MRYLEKLKGLSEASYGGPGDWGAPKSGVSANRALSPKDAARVRANFEAMKLERDRTDSIRARNERILADKRAAARGGVVKRAQTLGSAAVGAARRHLAGYGRRLGIV
jgi:hypothetical protein